MANTTILGKAYVTAATPAVRSSNFEIVRRGVAARDPFTISGILPAGALKVGTPLMISTSDVDSNKKTFVLADKRVDGFLTRESRVWPIRTEEELAFEFGMETPFYAGRDGSIEPANELVLEGPDYVDQGSGGQQITIDLGAAQDGSGLALKNGLFHIATTNDYAQYRLVKKLTPIDPANVRIHIVKLTSGDPVGVA